MNTPTFSTIGGYDYPKKEAMKIANFLRNYEAFSKRGATLPTGILFFGKPGTGKTMFAEAIINESGVPAFRLTSDAFYGNTNVSTAIGEIFRKAKENAPSIILVDELDNLVDCEPRMQKATSDKQREALRVMLTEIDKCKNSGVTVIATANCKLETIPQALVRTGRIERHVEIGLPTKDERESILNLYMNGHSEFANVFIKDIVSYTEDFTGSALFSLTNEVLIHCIAENKNASFNDFLDPIESIRTHGIKKQSLGNNDHVIYHEIGHFIADYVLNHNVGMINVIPYAQTGGRYTMMDRISESEKYVGSYQTLKNQCVVGISGLVATRLMMGDGYVGAMNDLISINNIYFAMLRNGLLGKELLSNYLINNYTYEVKYDDNGITNKHFSAFLNEIEEESRVILEANRPLIERLFIELKEKSVLTHYQIQEIVNAVEDEEKVERNLS